MSRDAPEMAFTAASLPLHCSEKKQAKEEVKTNREWGGARATGRGKGGKGMGRRGAAWRSFCFNIHILASEIIR